MPDLLYLALIALFFGAMLSYVHACEILGRKEALPAAAPADSEREAV